MISCRVRFRALAVLLALGVSLSACSKDEPDEGGTSVPRATTTSTTSAAERYAVPETITPEYVNDVLAALNHVYGDVVRKRIETRQLQPQDLVPLRAIYSETEFRRQSEALAKSPIGSAGDYRSPIGDRRITTTHLLTAKPTCIFLEGAYDFSQVATQPPPPRPVWVTLRPKDSNTDPEQRNPTPWAIASEELQETDKCAG